MPLDPPDIVNPPAVSPPPPAAPQVVGGAGGGTPSPAAPNIVGGPVALPSPPPVPEVVSGPVQVPSPSSVAGFDGAQALGVSKFSNANPMYSAHRLQPLRYSEASLGALLKCGASDLVDAIEVDARLTSDGVVVNSHDATVDRDTTSTGALSGYTAEQFAAMEMTNQAGTDTEHGYKTTSFEDLVRLYRNRKIITVEPKESAAVAGIIATLQDYDVDPDFAVVTTFTLTDLAAVIAAGYTAEYLVTDSSNIAAAQAAGVSRVAISQAASDSQITDWISAGFKVLAWTVSRRYQRDRLLALGVSGFYTDDVEYLRSNHAIRITDNFKDAQWMPGMIADNDTDYDEPSRGRFDGAGAWGWTNTKNSLVRDFVLQGYACPIKNDVGADSFKVNFDVEIGARIASTDWFGIHISDESVADRSYDNDSSSEERGYTALVRADGTMAIYRIDPAPTSVATQSTPAIANGEVVKFQLEATPANIKIHRLDSSGVITHTADYAGAEYRGGYFLLGRSRLAAKFSNILVS